MIDQLAVAEVGTGVKKVEAGGLAGGEAGIRLGPLAEQRLGR